jgi:endogenous inhibitor of DNA gyrase (YacG/DUF329 family)
MAGERKRAGPARCPICRRPQAPAFKPFCSARCRDQDLLNWLDGRYVIPAPAGDPEPEDEPSER